LPQYFWPVRPQLTGSSLPRKTLRNKVLIWSARFLSHNEKPLDLADRHLVLTKDSSSLMPDFFKDTIALACFEGFLSTRCFLTMQICRFQFDLSGASNGTICIRGGVHYIETLFAHGSPHGLIIKSTVCWPGVICE
jgi:hypothetical protein